MHLNWISNILDFSTSFQSTDLECSGSLWTSNASPYHAGTRTSTWQLAMAYCCPQIRPQSCGRAERWICAVQA